MKRGLPKILDNNTFKLCIGLAHFSKAEGLRFGSILQKNNHIIGVGYNRAIAHPAFRLERPIRQGYANHAEIEAINDALMQGNDPRGGKIYVAGYFTKSYELFLHEEFSCDLCIAPMIAYDIRSVSVPSLEGWTERTLYEAYHDAQKYLRGSKHNQRKASAKKGISVNDVLFPLHIEQQIQEFL